MLDFTYKCIIFAPMNELEITELIGKTLSVVRNNGDTVDFITTDGDSYQLYHDQDCCEGVAVEDVEGDLNDLTGSPITQAEEVASSEPFNGKPENPDSYTWTFYKLATVKGYVTIRWLGESNGYYSESVSFKKL